MRKLLPFIGMLLIAGTLFTSCKKEYYKDGGLANPKYNGTMFQFLQNNKDLFDTITYIIEKAGLKDTIEKGDVTFFCPTDQSVVDAMNMLNQSRYYNYEDSIQLADVPASVWKTFLERYILEGKHLAKQFARIDPNNIYAYPGINYVTVGGYILNIGLIYDNYGGVEAVGARTIRVTDIGFDPTNFLNNPSSMVMTSDIQPTNGVLHVLKFRTTFGFRGDFVRVVQQALLNE
ncbi:Fasciclin domain-containing protein [Chitinophaga terrae (ex Kim and Jung 2007)]|uniref:Fasciclin domain-containing protein n=1 Tax=Chitinophaga terrae (ex Kim and Jung 2007) TaxID=408074 RepID=A0A1H4BJE3_9BACT|nr:fasciclin domain-containing protein [Chitinophaga terrae (ex Kim and Jung 2007)]MDQ0109362.1 putative surface protein with fasciclin (FAS1) repeats [Chitinophaga terrae (ex Kim and Jung 2007)]GEP89601.1 hypothetical protein CTE07_12460 [Chitinophaga terrae (ex Kim and Jung 2007)]SEA48305.1 Fasciclin domain-containing protein [Chitinophaga terrae (ex Kim and Jung 2007)]